MGGGACGWMVVDGWMEADGGGTPWPTWRKVGPGPFPESLSRAAFLSLFCFFFDGGSLPPFASLLPTPRGMVAPRAILPSLLGTEATRKLRFLSCTTSI